jgi:hypothetical protein
MNAQNPFSPAVAGAFAAGLRALIDGRQDAAVAHLTDVAMQGTDRDRLLLADFLIGVNTGR